MSGNVDDESSYPCFEILTTRRIKGYLAKRLRQRGFHREYLDEAIEVAFQEARLALLDRPTPSTWPDWRRLLDSAVHRTRRELRPTGTCLIEDRAVTLDHSTSIERDELLDWAIDAVKTLSVKSRLVVKLKHAGYFFQISRPVRSDGPTTKQSGWKLTMIHDHWNRSRSSSWIGSDPRSGGATASPPSSLPGYSAVAVPMQ